jgi:hypothetical protein
MKGAHPRRPKTPVRWLAELACDLLLTLAAAGLLGGVALALWGLAAGGRLPQLLAGLAAFAIGAVLLLVWERVAWEPFAEELADQVSELT